MRISIVTDEISADPETAIELGVGWGIREFELRGFYTDRAPALSAYQRHHLRAVLGDYGARIVAISPGLFKFPLPPSDAPGAPLGWMEVAGFDAWDAARRLVRRHLEELLPAACDYANELGAGLIVAFSFARPDAPGGGGASIPDEVVDTLGRAAEHVAASGLRLVIETEAGFWGDDGAHTASLIRAVGHPAIGINWDPGNVQTAGAEAYPAGYELVRGLVHHVHFKDVRGSGEATEYVVEGEIDWPGQVRALADDGYDGYISVEPHMRPKVASSQASLERLRALIAAAESQAREEGVRG